LLLQPVSIANANSAATAPTIAPPPGGRFCYVHLTFLFAARHINDFAFDLAGECSCE
jgi:hypothetical protein